MERLTQGCDAFQSPLLLPWQFPGALGFALGAALLFPLPELPVWQPAVPPESAPVEEPAGKRQRLEADELAAKALVLSRLAASVVRVIPQSPWPVSDESARRRAVDRRRVLLMESPAGSNVGRLIAAAPTNAMAGETLDSVLFRKSTATIAKRAGSLARWLRTATARPVFRLWSRTSSSTSLHSGLQGLQRHAPQLASKPLASPTTCSQRTEPRRRRRAHAWAAWPS